MKMCPHVPAPVPQRKKLQIPLERRLGGSHGRSEKSKSLPLPSNKPLFSSRSAHTRPLDPQSFVIIKWCKIQRQNKHMTENAVSGELSIDRQCHSVHFFFYCRDDKVSEEESGKFKNYAHARSKNPARNLMDANQKLRVKDWECVLARLLNSR